jgi:DNA-binding CsgD family transcriptional regulator
MTVREAVIANGRLAHPRSPMEIADALGVSTATVHQAMSRARARGDVPVSRRQVANAIPPRAAVTEHVRLVEQIDGPCSLSADVLTAANALVARDDLEPLRPHAETLRHAGLRLRHAAAAIRRLGIALSLTASMAEDES